MPDHRKNLAIFMNNTDRSAFSERFEDDGEKTARLLRKIRPDWSFSVFDCAFGEFADDPTVFDGVVLTGSAASVNDAADWVDRLLVQIRQMVAAKTPLIGICFGHQAIAKALGGEVKKADMWEFGASPTKVHTTRPWMDPPRDDFNLFCANIDQVTRLPPQMTALGGHSKCSISLAALGSQVMSTQYHPELSHDFMLALIDEYGPHLGEEVTRRARVSVEAEVGADIMARWMVNFLEQAH